MISAPEAGLFARPLSDFPGREIFSSGEIERLREQAFARLGEKDWLAAAGEAWRHTPLSAIAATPYEVADAGSSAEREDDRLPPELAADLRWTEGASRLVFENGRFSSERSSLAPEFAGLHAEDLVSAVDRDPKAVEELFARAIPGENGVTLLNTAHASGGAFIDVPDGRSAPAPLHLVFLASANGSPRAIFPRTLVRLGKNAELRLVVTYAGAGTTLTAPVTQIALGENASLELVTLQRQGPEATHLSLVAVEQERSSRFASHLFSLGSAVSRDDIHAVLSGEGAECALNGLFVTEKSQRADLRTTVDHAKPHGTSRQTYRGILDGRSRAAFSGLVIVRPDAQKTDAQQSNKNLLLSKEALVNSTPQLEIRANDVKCKHGSTTGQLDADALFYLRSRGLTEETARNLLTYAFASDLLRRLPEGPVRAGIDRVLHERLPGAPAIEELAS